MKRSGQGRHGFARSQKVLIGYLDQHEPATGARNREETGEFKRLLNGMQRGALEGGAAEPRVVMRKVLDV